MRTSSILFVVILALGGFACPCVAQEIGRHYITHEGRGITVEGCVNDKGLISWYPFTPFNTRAREHRDKPGPNTEIPPSAVIVPPAKKSGGQGAEHPAPSDWRTGGVTRTPAKRDVYTAATPEAAQFVAEASAGKAEAKIHVTVIGNPDERARVLNDIQTDPSFSTLKDDLLIQAYGPDEWPVDPSLGFIPGKPAIIVQAGKGTGDPRGGRVIFRALDYALGASGLAEAIRKADPKYRPDLDPGPANPSIASGFDPSLLIVLGGFAFMLLLPKRKAT